MIYLPSAIFQHPHYKDTGMFSHKEFIVIDKRNERNAVVFVLDVVVFASLKKKDHGGHAVTLSAGATLLTDQSSS